IPGEHVAGRDRKRFLRDKIPRWDPLERGIDGGEENRRRLILLRAGNPGEHGHALGDERGMRRNPIIGQAVPGRKLKRNDIGGEESQRAGERAHALPVPAYDDEKAYGSGISARRSGAGKVGDDQSLGAVGNSGKRQRAVGCQQIGRRSGHAQLVRSGSWLNSRSRRNSAVSKFAGTSTWWITQASSSPSGTSSNCSNSASSCSLNCAMAASAKRPMIRSTSRMPRCHE